MARWVRGIILLPSAAALTSPSASVAALAPSVAAGTIAASAAPSSAAVVVVGVVLVADSGTELAFNQLVVAVCALAGQAIPL